MKEELFTKRLVLRKMQTSDANALFHIWSDPAVAAFMNISAFTHESQAIEMINTLNELAETNQAIRYSVIDLKSQEIIGSCGFNAINLENARVEIGYDIAKAHWGNGYAPESIQVLIHEAFENLGINRIEAKVEPANVNSVKVLKKLGFSFEGTLRQYEKVNKGFVDIQMYSLLKSD
ncbi:GNAT family protein [Oceanobacillus sp. FSL W7-1281]|uniref:GNAT family N-acetyltransferase n=1 Tax=Oceanobacillus TaxID=182709 RepID=UPI0030D9F6CE